MCSFALVAAHRGLPFPDLFSSDALRLRRSCSSPPVVAGSSRSTGSLHRAPLGEIFLKKKDMRFLNAFPIKDLLYFFFFSHSQSLPQGGDLLDFSMSLLLVYFRSHFLLTFLASASVSCVGHFLRSFIPFYFTIIFRFLLCSFVCAFWISSPNLGSLGESQLVLFGFGFGFSFSLIIHLKN